MAAGSQKRWSLSESAFRGLLRWLDEGADSGGEKSLGIGADSLSISSERTASPRKISLMRRSIA